MTVLMGSYFVAPSLQVGRLVVFRKDNELILSFGDQYSYVFSYSKEKLFIRLFLNLILIVQKIVFASYFIYNDTQEQVTLWNYCCLR